MSPSLNFTNRTHGFDQGKASEALTLGTKKCVTQKIL